MLIRRIVLTKSLHHLRFFSHAAIAVLPDLDDFPKPDPKYAETIHAVVRVTSGKNIAAKVRKASIVFEQEDGQHDGCLILMFTLTLNLLTLWRKFEFYPERFIWKLVQMRLLMLPLEELHQVLY